MHSFYGDKAEPMPTGVEMSDSIPVGVDASELVSVDEALKRKVLRKTDMIILPLVSSPGLRGSSVWLKRR
jgi:hypothetical protein